MSLNDRQKEAVEYIEGPLLVLAGPGTGKTHLLSARVEHILRATDTNPENILCLTFTESGASNMRERLISTIGAAARKVEIHTYHAFGTDLLGQYKNYAENFSRQLDEAIDEVVQYKIIREIQAGLPADDILKSGATKDIISTISEAKAARLTGDDLIFVAEENERVGREISKAVSPFFEAGKRGARFIEARDTVYLPILEVLAKFTSGEAILKDIEPVGNMLARELSRAIKTEEEKEKPSTKALSSWKDKCFEKDGAGHFRLKDRVANKKLKSLGGIMKKYMARLEAEGLYDFSDMIEQAIRMLREDDGFRLTMTERFQYIMLDEFQDTNPSQAELIRLLTDYERPNIMAVGDDDQAIFAFQGADASSLLNFQQFYNAKVVNLEINYRSNQEILDLSRRVADQISDAFTNNEGVREMGLNKRLTAFKGVGAEIQRHEFLTSDAEYEFLTKEIEKLIEKGVKQSEIAIICPKHKYIAPILPFLKGSGKINIAYEKKDNLLEDTRVGEILTLARFVDDLAQGKNVSAKLLEILAFPFLDIPPVEAISAVNRARLAHKAGLEYLVDSGNEKLEKFGEWLAKLSMLSFDTPLELMMDYLVGTVAVETRLGEYRSRFVEFYAKEQEEYATFELYENLSVVREVVKGHRPGKALRLRDLVETVDDYLEAGASVTNTSPYRDSADAVQVMTAHKSKGLEFEYVFLVAVDNMSWGKGKGNNNTLSLPKNMVQIRHTGATEDERLRLFFVAITRAKRVLYLTNSLKDFSGKSPARLDYLGEFEGENGMVVSPYIPVTEGAVAIAEGVERGVRVELHYEDLSEARSEVNLRQSWRTAYYKVEPELRPMLIARLENYRLNATDLTNFIDVSRGGPMDFYLNKVLRAPREPMSEALVFGNLVHKIFERVTKEKIDDKTALLEYRKEAEGADLGAQEMKDLLERGDLSLRVALGDFGDLLRAENSRAEVDLAVEHIMLGEVPVTGKIDHIQIDDENKKIEIYDFKTGKFKDKKWTSDISLFKYGMQLTFYREMLKRSAQYGKYTVERGHLLYVRPDEEGKVHDKVLEFEKERELVKTVEDLVPRVYRLMTSLEFLDREEFRLEADEKKGVKEMKEFIKKILDEEEKKG